MDSAFVSDSTSFDKFSKGAGFIPIIIGIHYWEQGASGLGHNPDWRFRPWVTSLVKYKLGPKQD